MEGPESEHGGAAIEIDESIPPALIQHALSQSTTHGIQHALSQSAALGIQQAMEKERCNEATVGGWNEVG